MTAIFIPYILSYAGACISSQAGGIFEVAEIYDAHGIKLAEAMTSQGKWIENELPEHSPPNYQNSFYESFWLHDDIWTLRVFTPLRAEGGIFTALELFPYGNKIKY